MVAGSPLFADVWPRFGAYLGQAVVIGHTVGFDLAVLKRECDLAGLRWTRPRTLDTRLLAQIAAPELAGYTLEKLAALARRRRRRAAFALGDAATTARAFLALVPKLRDRGIRTVAEAERTCLALTAVLDGQARSGWIEAVEAPASADAERTLRRSTATPIGIAIGTSCGRRRFLWKPARRFRPRWRGCQRSEYRPSISGRLSLPAASRRRTQAS